MKRFYKAAGVVEAEDGFDVQLDGRAIRTPAKKVMRLPTRPLAEAVAAEWNAQDDEIDRMAMPLNRMTGTAIDELAGRRAATAAAVANYARADMVCYWAEHPQTLIEQQQAAWRPLIDWVGERYGARLLVTSGILPIEQDPDTLARLRSAVDELDDFRLVGLSVAAGTASSLVIGLALVEQRLDAEAAFEAAQLDESYQIAEWGEDEIAATRRAGVLAEFRNVEAMIRALRS
ncbi:MAG: ATP12 family chaperone protein [Minwuia sp.]|uniref:ATP12 family chaperone protein n=1 Tax=Minwuia sp. TaxID=2493630 RepID=UPI003A88E0B1